MAISRDSRLNGQLWFDTACRQGTTRARARRAGSPDSSASPAASWSYCRFGWWAEPRLHSADHQRLKRPPVRLSVAPQGEAPDGSAAQGGGAAGRSRDRRPRLAEHVAQPPLQDELHALVYADADHSLTQQRAHRRSAGSLSRAAFIP